MSLKGCIISIVCAMLMFVLPGASYGDELYENTMVTVGLYYGDTAKNTYLLGDESLVITYKNMQIAQFNSKNSNNATVISAVYTNGEIYNDYNSAYDRAKALNYNYFVYFDGYVYYPVSMILDDLMNTLISTPKGVLLGNTSGNIFAYDSSQDINISTANDIMTIEGVSYRGKLILSSNGMTIKALNYVKLDEYLKGVVGREMSSSWEIEALKAQAVVARNFTIMSMSKHAADGFNICASTHCQVYGGIKSEATSVNKAVEETSGELIYYNGSPIQAYYHSSSGGHTESNENVWSGISLPYLRGVNDPYTIGYPNSDWTVELTSTQIRDALISRGFDVGEIIDIQTTKRSESGRTIELTVFGSSGSKVFYRDAIRSSISSDILKSTNFTIEKIGTGTSSQILLNVSMVNDINLKQTFTNLDSILSSRYSYGTSGDAKYVISGHGWGHGVGMSQYGAKGMAIAGYSYKDIIKYYFKDVEIR